MREHKHIPEEHHSTTGEEVKRREEQERTTKQSKTGKKGNKMAISAYFQ